MPVKIKIAKHGAKLVSATPASSPETLLQGSCHEEFKECKEVIQSSFDFKVENAINPSSNGFVRAAVEAYSFHHHLLIRPEDIWFAILTQLNIYINHHAEELRGKFVAHTGKKDLEVVRVGTRYTVDNGGMANQMGHLLQKNVVDPDLRRWVMPAFTTTSKNDEIVASILMMGALQQYFTYHFRYCCGIPSVTLLGERADWNDILERLEKLKTFGEEPAQWYRLLKPVLSRFVMTFDTPEAPEISDFWARMVNRRGGSGTDELSGWLTAFCLWTDKGKLLYQPTPVAESVAADKAGNFTSFIGRTRLPREDFCLDGQPYGRFDLSVLPHGYAKVPIKCDDNGYKFDGVMVAGSLGIKCSNSGEKPAEGGIGLNTVQSASGWLMYEKMESK